MLKRQHNQDKKKLQRKKRKNKHRHRQIYKNKENQQLLHPPEKSHHAPS
jgi:hypothetical protein